MAPERARDLLCAADQYLLEGLKRLCEAAIAQVGGHRRGAGAGRPRAWVRADCVGDC